MNSVVEIFLNGSWTPAASLQTLGPEACRFEYLSSYVFSDDPVPLALGFPVEFNLDSITEDEIGRIDRRPPPFVYDLVPQGQGRKYLVKALGLVDSDQLVLPLVTVGAFNPIGALRVNTAVDFYREQAELNPAEPNFDGVSLEDIRRHSDAFLEHISLHAMLASGTTGVQGVAPKYLLVQDEQGRWYADLALPDAQARAHWLLKLPRGRTEADRTVLRNEAAYLRVARHCGLRVHHDPMLIDEMLFVRRFDREVDAKGLRRLPQESLASLAGLRGFAPATSLNELVGALRQHVSDPAQETLEFIKRDVLNLALRNTDNHARNSAVQRTSDGRIRLTPVFDFAPMFMDPDIVSRNLHWRNREQVRITRWDQVIEALDLPDDERESLAAELRGFADVVSSLEQTALDCGVERDVLELCRANIDEQVLQLEQLPSRPTSPRPRDGQET